MNNLLMRLGGSPQSYKGAATPGVGPNATGNFSSYQIPPVQNTTAGSGSSLNPNVQAIIQQVLAQLGMGSGAGAGAGSGGLDTGSREM